MGTLLFQHSSTYASFMILMLLVGISYCQDEDDGYEVCRGTFDCGNLKGLSYPFWSETVADVRPQLCRREEFKLICGEGQDPASKLERLGLLIKNVSLSTNTMTIAIEDFCHVISSGIEMPWLIETLLERADGLTNISFFSGCNNNGVLERIPPQNKFPCPRDEFFYTNDTESLNRDLQGCPRIEIPVPREDMEDVMKGIDELRRLGREGFNVSYDYDGRCSRCNSSGGMCGTNTATRDFACHCRRDHPDPYTCFSDHRNVRMKVIIGVSAGVAGALLVCLIGQIYYRRRKKNIFALSSWVSRSITTSYTSSKSKSDIEKSGSEFRGVQIHLFSYDELVAATNNFASANELGDGGFGTVYKGKLQDKRVVAVKRLYENNYKRVEQFMNEVEILTGLRHPNLVSLYGCTSRHSRELLLVYEYIANGTVADHLHGDRKKNSGLPWSIRMKIAVETATALAYLHASDIIHRDVKTNNILLDSNFVVKVADFGLSRLFPTDVSHVSTAPQGTPGYVDPEYHECYQLTVKSDVYSFGVVLVELISSLPAVDITRHRHEINLSNMAINKIQSDALHELVDKNLGYETDYKVRKMINAVAELAFQCLQSAKEMRPSMVDVLKNLKQIQGRENNKMDETEDSEIKSDQVGLLKNGQIPPSPDTVTTQWSSSSYSTTSNTSG